jgi:hypothetical protein
MAKFLSIVDKNANAQILQEGKDPHKVSLPVQMAMQHYQQKESKLNTERKPTLLNKFFQEVEQEKIEEQHHKRQLINQYASVIAERVMMKESKLSERVLPGEEPQPGINRLTGKPISEPPAEPAPQSAPQPTQSLSSRYGPGYEGSPGPYMITVGGKDYKFAGRDQTGPGTGPVIKVPGGAIGIRGLAPVSVELGQDGVFYIATPVNENKIPGHSTGFKPGAGPGMQPIAELSTELLGRYKKASYADAKKADSEGDYARGDKRFKGINKATVKQFDNDLKKHEQNPIKEANAKKRTLKNSNPCWDGYKPVGTKKKGGRTVPNCVPKK